MAQKSNSSNGSTTTSDGNRSRSNSSSKTGGGTTPQLLLIELKQRIITALNKLSDRDTQHIAIEELERIAESLTPEGISLCLSCLYETDSQQKSTVRKECVKMFGTLASLHEELLSPHLTKIVNNIVKRLRDPDSSIRDACAEAMGTLSAKVSPLSSNGGVETNGNAFTGTLGVFAKPLFDVLNEQSRSVQVGAAMCLSEVIDNLKDPPPGALQRLCPRIIKLLNNSTFSAKAALLTVIASIVQAGGAASHQSLAMVMACVQECLKSSDWATRKSASETLASIASATNCPSLSSFKPSVIESLESCRFDKVKPVRDMVIQTLQVWKRFPDSDSGVHNVSSIKENSCNESQDIVIAKRKVEGMDQNHSDNEIPDFGCFGFTHTRSGANKIHGDSQKKRAPVTDKKGNAPFFGKTEKKDKWQIDISVPHLTGGIQDDMETPKQQGKERKSFQERFTLGRIVDHLELLETSNGRQTGETSVVENSPHISLDNQGFKESICMSSSKSRSSVTKQSSCVVDSSSQLEEVDMGSWSVGAGTVDSSSSSIVESQSSISENDSALIKRQLCHIENQQSSILELLQKFMNRSEESLLKLEARISGVESNMAHLVMDLMNGRYEGDSGRCSNKVHATLDDIGSRTLKRTDISGYSQERPLSSEGIRSGRKSPIRSPRIGTNIAGFGELRFGSSACALPGNVFSETQGCNNNSRRIHLDVSSESLLRTARNEGDSNSFSTKGIQERGPISSRLGNGEGPSARSIWQASKDEATLAAIRVAGGEDGRLMAPEGLKAITSERTHLSSEVKQEVMRHKTVVGGQGKSAFWSLWARAAEFLRSGDVDSAYVDVLCAGDELLLVRLMSRTGPVLEQLSNGTAQELLGTIILLMLHQSFLDVIIPWLQQVVDLVTNNGSDCLGFSSERKRELMDSLEEASTSNYPEKWIPTTLREVSIQLGTTWGLT